jgi:hypothetical protein
VTLLLALALTLLAAPSAPGQWHQLGAALKSKPGKQIHFFRTATSPKNLSVVVDSSSKRPIHVYWWTYCEFESDDAAFEEHHQTITGKGTLEAYPPVLSGATLCYITVNAGAGGRSSVSAAVFDN